MAFEPDIGEEIETEGTLMQVSVPAKTDPVNPNNISDPIQAFGTALREDLSLMENCIPAMVLSFNRVTHIASVIPLCNAKANTGQATQRMPITVHVWRFASGGKIIDLPVKSGDTGWLIGADFDTGGAQSKNANFDPEKNEGPQTPTTGDIHRYSFGFFLPDNFCSFPDIERFGDDIVVGEFDENGNITSASIGGGGGISMFAYNTSSGIVNGGFITAQRKWVKVEPIDLSTYATMPHSLWIDVVHNPGQNITASFLIGSNWVEDTTNMNPTDLRTFIPIYDFDIDSRSVKYDYRIMPCVPLYGA